MHEVWQDSARPCNQVFIPDDMNGNLVLLKPVSVEVTPDSDFIANPGFPLQAVVSEVRVEDRAVVSASAVHVEQRNDAVEGRSHQQHCFLARVKQRATSFRKVRFHELHALVANAFSLQANIFQGLMQGALIVTVRA